MQLGLIGLGRMGSNLVRRLILRAIRSFEELFNYDLLYIGGGNARRITVDLPRRVKIVQNVAGLLGGIALWRGTEGSDGV